MKETFPGYYHPTDDEFSELWANCLFVPDANVLLSLYELSPGTAAKLEEIFTQFADRGQLWVPHQAALEYQRRRRDVIEAQARGCDALRERLDKTERKLREVCEHRRPPYLDQIDALLDTMQTTFGQITEKLAEWKQQRLNLLDADDIRDRLDHLLEGRLGSAYAEQRLEEIYKEAELRYMRHIPPGYKAFKKVDPNSNREHLRQYGDVILWFQVIDHAKEIAKPIIIVTNEGQEDWWEKSNSGQRVGPRAELVHEMQSKARASFYMYRIEPFIKHAGRHLELEVTGEVIKEAQTLERQADREAQTLEALQLLHKDPYRGLSTFQDIAFRVMHENRAFMDALGLALTDVASEAVRSVGYSELVKRQLDEQNAWMRTLSQVVAREPQDLTRELLDLVERQTRAYGIGAEDIHEAPDEDQGASPSPRQDEGAKAEPNGLDTESKKQRE